jgi:bifunctional non-homologous end joining protein LigD
VTWEEVERALKKKDGGLLVFEAPQVVSRVEKLGDLFEPMLELKQRLPDLKGAVAEAPKAIEIAAQAEEDDPPRTTGKKETAGKKTARKSAIRKKPGKV